MNGLKLFLLLEIIQFSIRYLGNLMSKSFRIFCNLDRTEILENHYIVKKTDILIYDCSVIFYFFKGLMSTISTFITVVPYSFTFLSLFHYIIFPNISSTCLPFQVTVTSSVCVIILIIF